LGTTSWKSKGLSTSRARWRSSPWAYLGGPRLQDIVRRHRARLVLKPFDFQEVVPKISTRTARP
jgi:hypothetical protein